ncbi:hypothetical protein TcasGA2_TC010308 [Tribolium castaneum]|uniref:Uncharacterized protein n=1 Tax=Tribolium castaneum TaxID=7070 RepID=D7EKJ6_TRICA|nr:hypothetical protein TcasGA2_TC010308 [Tribolium castaneum]
MEQNMLLTTDQRSPEEPTVCTIEIPVPLLAGNFNNETDSDGSDTSNGIHTANEFLSESDEEGPIRSAGRRGSNDFGHPNSVPDISPYRPIKYRQFTGHVESRRKQKTEKAGKLPRKFFVGNNGMIIGYNICQIDVMGIYEGVVINLIGVFLVALGYPT